MIDGFVWFIDFEEKTLKSLGCGNIPVSQQLIDAFIFVINRVNIQSPPHHVHCLFFPTITYDHHTPHDYDLATGCRDKARLPDYGHHHLVDSRGILIEKLICLSFIIYLHKV